MRIAVVGLGGVGGYIGAKFCFLKNEDEIIFIARGKHLQAIKDKGLKLIDVEDENYYQPTLACETYDKALDIIFLCTKSYHSKSALKNLSKAITDKTIVIPIANGVDSIPSLQNLTPAKLIDACVYIVSHKLDEGVIKKSTNVFALILPEELETRLASRLEKAGLRTKFAVDIKKEVWKKYLFISAMGTMTSFYEKGMGSIFKENNEELKNVLKEIFSVAQAEGIKLEEKEMDKALHTASKLPLDAPTSLWLDFQNSTYNEHETICTYIVKTAQAHKIEVPLMQNMNKKLSGK